MSEFTEDNDPIIINHYCCYIQQTVGPATDCAIRRSWRVPSAAIQLFRKFFGKGPNRGNASLLQYDPRRMVFSCIFLASKIEESFIRVQELAEMLNSQDPSNGGEQILRGEALVLELLDYNMQVCHPYRCASGLIDDYIRKCKLKIDPSSPSSSSLSLSSVGGVSGVVGDYGERLSSDVKAFKKAVASTIEEQLTTAEVWEIVDSFVSSSLSASREIEIKEFGGNGNQSILLSLAAILKHCNDPSVSSLINEADFVVYFHSRVSSVSSVVGKSCGDATERLLEFSRCINSTSDTIDSELEDAVRQKAKKKHLKSILKAMNENAKWSTIATAKI